MGGVTPSGSLRHHMYVHVSQPFLSFHFATTTLTRTLNNRQRAAGIIYRWVRVGRWSLKIHGKSAIVTVQFVVLLGKKSNSSWPLKQTGKVCASSVVAFNKTHLYHGGVTGSKWIVVTGEGRALFHPARISRSRPVAGFYSVVSSVATSCGMIASQK